eukprot:4349047-Amphidinium_carterae.1
MPWDAVLRHASSDEALSFWSREVTDKAHLFLSSVLPSASLVDTGLLGSVGPASALGSSKPEPEQSRKRVRSGGGRQSAPQDGRFRNRAGKEICERYNSIEGCSLPCPSGHMHQCRICMRMGHNALNCWQAGKGKGKAKQSAPPQHPQQQHQQQQQQSSSSQGQQSL